MGTDLLLEILFRTKLHLRFHLCGIKIKHRNLSNVNAVAMLRTFLSCVMYFNYTDTQDTLPLQTP